MLNSSIICNKRLFLLVQLKDLQHKTALLFIVLLFIEVVNVYSKYLICYFHKGLLFKESIINRNYISVVDHRL